MARGIIKDKVYIKYEKEKGKLNFVKPSGAWTLNLDEVNPEEFDTIKFITEKSIYKIPTYIAMTSGFSRVMGGEKKQIIPIQYFKKEALCNVQNVQGF